MGRNDPCPCGSGRNSRSAMAHRSTPGSTGFAKFGRPPQAVTGLAAPRPFEPMTSLLPSIDKL
ncbi:MAG: SEC-C metal-binding domain-containing protein [Burkholderiaceae bacterium]